MGAPAAERRRSASRRQFAATRTAAPMVAEHRTVRAPEWRWLGRLVLLRRRADGENRERRREEWCSCALRSLHAKQAVRFEHQHENQDGENDGVGPGVADELTAERFDEADQQATEH